VPNQGSAHLIQKDKIPLECGLADGETRTRTGDTTIFSCAVHGLGLIRTCCKQAGFGPLLGGEQTPQIPFFPREFGRRRAPRLPIELGLSARLCEPAFEERALGGVVDEFERARVLARPEPVTARGEIAC
jgi:hypothetical protein